VFLGIAGVAFNLHLYGDALHQLHVYNAPLQSLNLEKVHAEAFQHVSGHWSWPFVALLTTPLNTPVPAWKIVYIYVTAAGTLILLARPARRFWLSGGVSPLEFVFFLWLAGNTAASCAGGPYWGFMSFDRYVTWAWPAALVLNADLVISHPRLHALAAGVSILLTVFVLVHHA
jgi:hypothetical protein